MPEILSVIIAAAGVAVSLQQLTPNRRRSIALLQSLEILDRLPADSSAREALNQVIEDQAHSYIKSIRAKRSWLDIGSGVYLVIMAFVLWWTEFLMPWAAPVWLLSFAIGFGSIIVGLRKVDRFPDSLSTHA